MASLEDLTTDQLLEVARLQQTLSTDPATRESYLRLVKQVNPKLSVPEIDVRDRVDAQLATEREKFQKLEEKFAQKEIQDRVEKARNGVKSKHGLSDDQLTQVEKLMTEKHIPDYDTAAEFFSMSQRTAVPTSTAFSRPSVDMPESAVWGKGIGNKAALDKIARSEAYKAWGEVFENSPNGLGRAS